MPVVNGPDRTMEVRSDLQRVVRRAAFAIYAVAVIVRATLIFGFARYEIGRPEPVRVALSLARNGTFSDPYTIPTGPTAHVAPLYPLMIAPIYRALGDTETADRVRMGMSILVGAAEYALLPCVSASLGMGALAGAAAGFAGAAVPLHYWVDSIGEFETAWAAIFLELTTIWFARWLRAARFSARGGAAAGLWAGAGMLVSPSLLPVLGGFGALAIAAGHAGRKAGALRAGAACVLAAVAVVSPWTIRNRHVMGGWVPIRDNLGIELATSNCDGARPDIESSRLVEAIQPRHPGWTAEGAAVLKRKGELAFEREAKSEAVAWIRTHPIEFARLTASRIRNFWFPASLPWPNSLGIWAISAAAAFGLFGLWRGNRFAAGVLAIPLVTYPPIFYVIKNGLRYQHPIAWVLLLLAAWLAVRGRPGAARTDGTVCDS